MSKRCTLPTILSLCVALVAVPATVQAIWLMKWKDTIEGEHKAVEVDLLRPSSSLLAGSRGPGEVVVRLREPLARHPSLARAVQSGEPLPLVVLSEEAGTSAQSTYLKYELEKVSIVALQNGQELSLHYGNVKSTYVQPPATR